MNALRRIHDYARVADALADVPADVRADSQGRPLSPGGQLWGRYLASVPDDARPALQGVPASVKLALRADSMYLAGDLVDRASTFTTIPQRVNALAQSIPVQRITPFAETWTAVTSKDSGMAKVMKTGSEDLGSVGYDLDEQAMPVVMFGIDVVEAFGEAERRQIAQSEAARAAGSQAEQQRRALYAHLAAHNGALLSGINGVGIRSLQDVPCLQSTGSATYDGTSSNADEALSEFREMLDLIPEESEGTAPAPDTMFCTRRYFNGLSRFANFEAGGPGLSEQAVQSILSGAGITQVVFADELKDFGGSNADLVLLFNRADPRSLRQRIGIEPGPIGSFSERLARHTRFGSSTGGLWSELTSSTLKFIASVA